MAFVGVEPSILTEQGSVVKALGEVGPIVAQVVCRFEDVFVSASRVEQDFAFHLLKT